MTEMRKIEARDAKRGMHLRRAGQVHVWNEETQTDGVAPFVEVLEILEDAEEWGDKYAALSVRVVSYSGPDAHETWHQAGFERSDGETRRWEIFEIVKDA